MTRVSEHISTANRSTSRTGNKMNLDSSAVIEEVSSCQLPCSPIIPLEKPSKNALPPISPTSTAEVFFVLDESLGAQLNVKRIPQGIESTDPSLSGNVPPLLEDDDSLLSSDDEMEEDEEELLGLSFLEEDYFDN